jgi:ectoine hydroxylase-related dioxygenase (phytanoyl-CoA dioxygenase family)
MTMVSTQRTAQPLDAERIAAFQRDGFLVVPDVLRREELAELDRALHARHLEQQARLRAAPPDANDRRTREERENHLHGLGDDFAPAVRMAHDEPILGLVSSLVGPGISLHSAKLISKGPRETRHFCHWHQDDAYWWDVSQSACRLSVWIPLVDSGPHNGGLRVAPGHFRRDVVPHLPRSTRDHGSCRLSFAPGEERLPDERELTVPAGALVLFSARAFHASSGNPSDQHRRAFILTFQEASTVDFGGRLRVIRPA